jgi:hypothetical protein
MSVARLRLGPGGGGGGVPPPPPPRLPAHEELQMARSSRMSVNKRLRERKKAEKAELKRAQRRLAGDAEREPGTPVAAREDLESYGILVARDGNGEDA